MSAPPLIPLDPATAAAAAAGVPDVGDVAEEAGSGRDFIRPVESRDRTTVEQLVGQGYMEGLAVANRKVYTSPAVIVTVIIIGFTINYLMGLHLVPITSPLGYAQYLIGPCIVVLPVLAAVEWLQKPAFDTRIKESVAGWRDGFLESYYSPDVDAMSGAWVFEHKDTIAGVVVLDARTPGQPLPSPADVAASGAAAASASAAATARVPQTVADINSLRNRKPVGARGPAPPEGAPRTAEIRHLNVLSPYRRHGVATELLGAALDMAFGLAPGDNEAHDTGKQATVARVIALTSPFGRGSDRIWDKMGFVRVPYPERVQARWRSESLGLFDWEGHWMAVDREAWLKAREELYSRFAPQKGMEFGEGRDVAPDGTLLEKKKSE